jgi:4-amino-4-deoxy-L-arabinose transferase-like glycosyltransferase
MTSADAKDRHLFDRLFAALTDPGRRERTVILALLGYVAIWTLYGVLAKGSQDIHPDMSELANWSRNLALGYWKHPPLAAWLVAAWFAVFPYSDWAFYLLGMATAGVALWFAWHVAADYLDADKRVLALALLMFIPFFNFHALKFNANTVLMPLWGATTLCFLRSFERRSVGWAALAGLCAAAAMFGKYWSIFLLAGLGLAVLFDSRRGAYFRSAAPWVTIGVGAVALAPHLIWVMANNFDPISYALSGHHGSENSHWWRIASYFTDSAAYVALLALAAVRPGRAALLDIWWPAEPARRLAVLAYWGPLVLPVLILPLAKFNLTSLWSMSALTLLPVVLLSPPAMGLQHRAVVAIVAAAATLPVIMVVAAPTIASAIHRDPDMAPASIHSRLLANRVAEEWRRATEKPLRRVGGDYDLAFGAAFYLPGRPEAFLDSRFDVLRAEDSAQVRHEGIALICWPTDRPCLDQSARLGFPSISIDVDIARTYDRVAGRAIHYVILIIPPTS